MRPLITLLLLFPSLILASSLTYHSALHFSDVITGIPVQFEGIGELDPGDGSSISTSPLSHVYHTPGDYIARLITNDSVVATRVSVVDAGHKRHVFCASLWTADSFVLQVCDASNISASRTDELTRSFIALGEYPSGPGISLRKSISFWRVSFNESLRYISLFSSGTVIDGCGIQDEHFLIGTHASYDINNAINVTFAPIVCSPSVGQLLINNIVVLDTNGTQIPYNDTVIDSIAIYRTGLLYASNGNVKSGDSIVASFMPPIALFGGSTACPFGTDDTQIDTAFVVYSNGSDLNEVAVSTDMHRTVWERVNLGQQGRIAGAVWCQDEGINVYLLTDETGLNARIVTDKVAFTFPANVHFTGLHFHVGGACSLIAYGEQVWVSLSGAHHFTRILSADVTNVVSTYDGSYGVLCDDGAVYYGKLGVEHAVPLLAAGTGVNAIMFDVAGDLHTLTGPSLIHNIVPLKARLRSSRLSFGNLVPHFIGYNRVKFTSGSFLDSHVGLDLTGGFTITDVINGDAICTGTLPATYHADHVDVTMIDGSVLLQQNSTMWNKGHVGQTVVLKHAGSVLITSVVNTTMAIGTGDIETGSYMWLLMDYRAIVEGNKASPGQILDVMSTHVALSYGNMEWSSKHRGALLNVANGTGVLMAIHNASVATVKWFKVPALSQYNEWSLNWPDEDGLMSAWALTLGVCSLPEFDVSHAVNEFHRDSSDVLYLDTTDKLLLTSSGSADYFFSNPIIVDYNVSNNVLHASGLQYSSGALASTSILVHPKGSSIMCQTTWLRARIVIGCPYGKDVHAIPFDGEHERIPVNYRPPSKLGVAIPTSTRFYNADPSLPKYRNEYRVSKSSGVFSSTSCSDNSYDFGDTECLTSVPRVFYGGGVYIPRLVIRQGLVELPQAINYTLEELNGRTDWCINATDVIDCSNRSRIESHMLHTNLFDGISWSGPELYHFRVTVHSDSVCVMKNDFAVWVFQPPNDETIVMSLASITAVLMALFLLFAFLVYF